MHSKALLSPVGRLPGVDGDAKMSKSLRNAIPLSAREEDIHRAVMAMYTDRNHLKVTDPGRVEGNIVFTYLDAFHLDKSKIASMKERYLRGGLGDRYCKNELEQCLQELLAPIRERRQHLINDRGCLTKVLYEGSEKAKGLTQQTLDEIKKGLGLPVMF